MLYRENGQFKSTYAADQQLLPTRRPWFGIVESVCLTCGAALATIHVPGLIVTFVILDRCDRLNPWSATEFKFDRHEALWRSEVRGYK